MEYERQLDVSPEDIEVTIPTVEAKFYVDGP